MMQLHPDTGVGTGEAIIALLDPKLVPCILAESEVHDGDDRLHLRAYVFTCLYYGGAHKS